jgi:DNA-binding MarR family transcriptional regulator
MAPHRPLNRREMAVWRAFLTAHARVMRRLEAELVTEEGLSLAAYELLAALSEMTDRRARMTELTSLVFLTPSGVTRLVDKLEREGFVRRERCTADARVVYTVLTDEGFQRLEEAYQTHLRGVREHVVDRLGREELETVTAAMNRLAEICDTQAPARAAEPA